MLPICRIVSVVLVDQRGVFWRSLGGHLPKRCIAIRYGRNRRRVGRGLEFGLFSWRGLVFRVALSVRPFRRLANGELLT